jgi:hypothetical protein
MLQFFSGIWSWFTDPKNKSIRNLIGIAILVAIILMQCGQNKGLKNDLEAQKGEAQRIQNNYEALKDTIRQGKINDTTWLAERQALKLTMEELKKNYSDMLVGFEQFRKQTPKVIERFTVNNYETIKEVPVYAKIDSLGNGTFAFNDTANFADGNYRKLRGTIPFSSKFFNKKDSNQVDLNKVGLYTQISPGNGNFILEQGMKLKVGLFEDPKTKKVSISVLTSYPGITFTQLEGADIMSDDISRKAARNLRKTWGIGLTLGYGAGVNLKTSQVFFGPQMGIGITYTPKFLQWGK